jgi:NADH-quinone oxidoreductase subunit L
MGAITLVTAGLIALVQTDIKRSIAYSTMSQIGYMFVAVGIGASSAAMFHLMTHAFFKALLFLGAGIVIHALHEEQDMRRMGGLKKLMPITYKLFMIGSLALAGIIPLSGFFSKDEIIMFAFSSANPDYLGVVGVVTVGLALIGVVLTGLYSFRLMFLVFHGKQNEASKRLADEGLHHGHEAPRSMMAPVLVLGLLSLIGGWLVIPGAWNLVGDFLHHADAAPVREALHHVELSVAQGWMLAVFVSLPLALLGIALARAVWLTGSLASWRTKMPGFERVLQSGFGWDGLYERIAYRPAVALAMFVRRVLEQGFFVPSVDWVGGGVRAVGRGVGRLHTGLLRTYAFGTAVGALAIVLWLFVEKV